MDTHLLTDLLLSEQGPDYVICYSDLHPFHGGKAFKLHSSGELVYYTGQSEADSQTFRVSKQDVFKVRDLFIKYELWRQIEPERPENPDESRAYASIIIGDAEIITWEWFNDLAKNDRLIRLARQFKSMVETGATD